jgi:hypothetical protein
MEFSGMSRYKPPSRCRNDELSSEINDQTSDIVNAEEKAITREDAIETVTQNAAFSRAVHTSSSLFAINVLHCFNRAAKFQVGPLMTPEPNDILFMNPHFCTLRRADSPSTGKFMRQISANSGESRIFPSLTSNWNVSSSLQYSNPAFFHEALTVMLVVTNSYPLKILTN